MHGVLETGSGAELLDQLERCAHRVERWDLQHLHIVQPADDAFVLVLREQSFQDGAGLRAVLGEHVALFHVVGPVAPGERRLVEGDVADQVEGVEVFADFLQQRVEYRNQSIHAGDQSDKVKTHCFQLQLYFDHLVWFHLANTGFFNSLEETNAFLDLSPDKSSLVRSKQLVHKAIRFVS